MFSFPGDKTWKEIIIFTYLVTLNFFICIQNHVKSCSFSASALTGRTENFVITKPAEMQFSVRVEAGWREKNCIG